MRGLRRKLDRLAAFPTMATEWRPNSPVRVCLYHQRRIIYRITNDGIEVGRILHHARELTRLLDAFLDRAQREQPVTDKPADDE